MRILEVSDDGVALMSKFDNKSVGKNLGMNLMQRGAQGMGGALEVGVGSKADFWA